MTVNVSLFADTPDELFALMERMGGTVAAHNLTERLEAMSEAMQTALDTLRTNVERLETVEDAVQAFVEGVPGMIRTAVAEAVANGATPEQLAALNDLASRIGAEADDLSAAVLANTPAEPEGGAAEPAPTDPAEPAPSPAPVEPPTV